MGCDNVDPPEGFRMGRVTGLTKHKYADLSDKKVAEIENNSTCRVLFMSIALVFCCLFICMRGCSIPQTQYSRQEHERKMLKMLIDADKVEHPDDWLDRILEPLKEH